MMTLLVFTVVAAVSFWLFVLRSRYYRLMAVVPTAAGLPFIGGVHYVMTPREDIIPTVLRMIKNAGPVMKVELFGLHRVILTGPDEIGALLNCKENLTKDSTYTLMRSWLGTGLLTSPGGKWRGRRRMLNPAFHYKILEDFVHVFNANSAILVAKLRQHTADKYVEINEPVALCALDTICETAMGTSVNAQQGKGVEYVRAVTRMCEIFMKRILNPWLANEFIFNLTSFGKEHKQIVNLLQDFSGKVIKKQRALYNEKKGNPKPETSLIGERKRRSFMDMMFEISDTEALTDEDIREEVNTFMFAGHDTTAAATSWALFLLGLHPDVQDKVVAELSSIFGSDERQPTMADLNNMTYMEQVVKEALRIYPSVPSFGRVLTSDLKVGKYILPAGLNVGVFAYGLHRNPQIYPDPERFDPERFSTEQASGRHPFAYIPFSVGPRNCIGQKFSRLEEKSILCAVLRSFKVTSLDSPEDVKPLPDVVLKPKKDIRMHFAVRE